MWGGCGPKNRSPHAYGSQSEVGRVRTLGHGDGRNLTRYVGEVGRLILTPRDDALPLHEPSRTKGATRKRA